MKIKIVKRILSANDEIAEQNKILFKENNVFVINVMGCPGSGKTTLLEKTIPFFKDRLNLAVIEADIATTRDAQRIRKLGVEVVQLHTGGACHIDANMLRNCVNALDLKRLDLLFIENVGNLVCPAEFALGESVSIVVLSLSEGDDKPRKYPLIFLRSELLIINKIDLSPYVDCSIKKLKEDAKRVNHKIEVIELSCRTGDGLDKWYEWLNQRIKEVL